MAELWANMIRSPNISNTMIMGVIHHHLFCKKNFKSSPAIPILFVMPSRKLIGVISYLGFDQDGRAGKGDRGRKTDDRRPYFKV
jgi:hypothetical protein